MKTTFDNLDFEIQKKVLNRYDFRKGYFENDWLLWFADYLLNVIKDNEVRYLATHGIEITQITLTAGDAKDRNYLGEAIIQAKIKSENYDFESNEKYLLLDTSKENFGLDQSFDTESLADDLNDIENGIYRYFDMYYYYNFEDDLFDDMRSITDIFFDTLTGEITE